MVAGTRSDEPVSTIDFVPTVRQILKDDDSLTRPLDGISMLPALQEKPLGRARLFWHFPHSTGFGGPDSAVRENHLKLIKFYEDDHAELYDLSHDLGEQHDLAHDRPDDTRRLETLLKDWLKEVDAQIPRRDTYHATSRASPE